MPVLNYFRKMAAVWIIALPFVFSSCYSYRVATQALPGTEASKTATAHSFFWGLIKKPTLIHTPICDSLEVNGLAEVTVKNNFGYALITVATLGIWSPMKVEWKCGKPCKKIGTL
jgi:Bor protein